MKPTVVIFNWSKMGSLEQGEFETKMTCVPRMGEEVATPDHNGIVTSITWLCPKRVAPYVQIQLN